MNAGLRQPTCNGPLIDHTMYTSLKNTQIIDQLVQRCPLWSNKVDGAMRRVRIVSVFLYSFHIKKHQKDRLERSSTHLQDETEHKVVLES